MSDIFALSPKTPRGEIDNIIVGVVFQKYDSPYNINSSGFSRWELLLFLHNVHVLCQRRPITRSEVRRAVSVSFGNAISQDGTDNVKAKISATQPTITSGACSSVEEAPCHQSMSNEDIDRGRRISMDSAQRPKNPRKPVARNDAILPCLASNCFG